MSTPKSESTRVIVVGATGRIGSQLCFTAHNDPDFELVATVCARDHGPSPALSVAGDETSPLLQTTVNTDTYADVVIDFSTNDGAQHALRIAEQTKSSVLIGTTALNDETMQLAKKISQRHAVVLAPNTSLGIAVLHECVRIASTALGASFECSIVESHHKHKKDAPSGTALSLASEALSAGATVRADQILAIRGGDVSGEHTVRFAGPSEYIELTHRAQSRDLFVRGALLAAKWLDGHEPGCYSMSDVVAIGAS